MCGKSTENLVRAKVAGSVMNLCNSCKNLGKYETDLKSNVSHSFYHKKRENKDTFILVDDYTSQINSALAKKNLTPHHLARALNIKESLIHKVLTNKFDLEIDLARKIEKFLDISIVIKDENLKSDIDVGELMVSEDESSAPSLADLIKEKFKGK